MLSVIIAANSQDKKFWSAVQNIVSRSFKTVHCIGGCLDARCENAEILLADAACFDLVYSDTAIMIFKDTEEIAIDFATRCQTVAVVDSSDNETLQAASKTKLPAITCGLSPKDTITLSSINQDRAVIDIQRSITCFDGTVIEPQEIPVSLYSSIDNFALMCVAAIFILSGNLSRLFEMKI